MNQQQGKPEQTQLVSHSVVLHQALATPACRTVLVVVAVMEGPDEYEVQFFPVLAIKAITERNYTKWVPPNRVSGPYNCASHEDLVADGWGCDVVVDRFDVVVAAGHLVCARTGLASLDYFNEVSEAYRVMAAPWPPEEDAERFKDLVAFLVNEARRKLKNSA